MRDFVRCYGLALMVAAFMVPLDMAYRLDSLLRYLVGRTLVANVNLVVLAATLASLLLAAVLWVLDRTATLICRGRPACGRTATFLAFVLAAYVNAMYFKLHAMTSVDNVVVTSQGRLACWLFLGLVSAGILVVRRYPQEQIDHLARSFAVGGLKLTGVAMLVFPLALVVSPIQPSRPAAAANLDRPHILILTFDSMSAGHMSLYGYRRRTTPHMEQMATESYVFQRAHCNANATVCSLRSMTGRYPRLSEEMASMPGSLGETLEQDGYHDRLLITHTRPQTDLRRGFSEVSLMWAAERNPMIYRIGRLLGSQNVQWFMALLSEDARFYVLPAWRDPRDIGGIPGQPFPLPRYLDSVVDRLANATSPSLVWLHAWEAHNPYLVPEPYYSRFGTSIADRYDGSILYADAQVGRLVAELKARGLYDHCILVISSDHGEGHGGYALDGRPTYFHGGDWLTPALENVPLLIHVPKMLGGVRVQTFAELVDIPPTLLDLVGLPVPSWMEGESLKPYLEHPERMSHKLKLCVSNAWFVLARGRPIQETPASWLWKDRVMCSGFWDRYRIGLVQRFDSGSRSGLFFFAVYDVLTDPGERRNLVGDPRFHRLLDRIATSPLVQCYAGTTAPWSLTSLSMTRTHTAPGSPGIIGVEGDFEMSIFRRMAVLTVGWTLLTLLLGGCGGSNSVAVVDSGTPAVNTSALKIAKQPDTVATALVGAQSSTVVSSFQLVDSAGNPLATAGVAVNVALVNNPGGATLVNPGAGTVIGLKPNAQGVNVLTATAITDATGLATLSFQLDQPGAANRLEATIDAAPGFSIATEPFDIIARQATTLAFTSQPASAQPQLPGNTPNDSAVVTLRDQFGDPMPNQDTAVTLAIDTNPGNGSLTNVLPSNPLGTSNGQGQFAFQFGIDTVGTGYTLVATANNNGLTITATSLPFDIANVFPTNAVFDESQPNGQQVNQQILNQDATGTFVPRAVTVTLTNEAADAIINLPDGSTPVTVSLSLLDASLQPVDPNVAVLHGTTTRTINANEPRAVFDDISVSVAADVSGLVLQATISPLFDPATNVQNRTVVSNSNPFSVAGIRSDLIPNQNTNTDFVVTVHLVDQTGAPRPGVVLIDSITNGGDQGLSDANLSAASNTRQVTTDANGDARFTVNIDTASSGVALSFLTADVTSTGTSNLFNVQP